MQREEKGREIATHRLIERKDKLWEVPSQSGKGKYIVDLEKPSCSCPDFTLRGLKYKHIYAVEYTLTPPTEAVSTGSLTKRPTYRQDWPAYHAAQTHEKAHFQALLYDLCRGINEPIHERGRYRLPWSEMVFSAAFKVYSTTSTRRFMSELVQASAYGYISSVPHYNSILNAFQNPDLTPLLHDLIEESSFCLKSVEAEAATSNEHQGPHHGFWRQPDQIHYGCGHHGLHPHARSTTSHTRSIIRFHFGTRHHRLGSLQTCASATTPPAKPCYASFRASPTLATDITATRYR